MHYLSESVYDYEENPISIFLYNFILNFKNKELLSITAINHHYKHGKDYQS